MESSAIFTLSNPSFSSFFPPKPSNKRAASHRPWRNKQRASQPTQLQCHKMYVPGFGEASPESKAANNLHSFFTYIAVKIVSAQLESYNPEAYEELMEFLGRHSLNDGDKFCASLMRESPRHKGLGKVDSPWFVCNFVAQTLLQQGRQDHESFETTLRILEVRSAYCKNDFEWENLRRLAIKMVDESNIKIMRDYVQETSHVEN